MNMDMDIEHCCCPINCGKTLFFVVLRVVFVELLSFPPSVTVPAALTSLVLSHVKSIAVWKRIDGGRDSSWSRIGCGC
jgi:hypothetical protein